MDLWFNTLGCVVEDRGNRLKDLGLVSGYLRSVRSAFSCLSPVGTFHVLQAQLVIWVISLIL